eukprot:1745821-Rhodomonas_salina.3
MLLLTSFSAYCDYPPKSNTRNRIPGVSDEQYGGQRASDVNARHGYAECLVRGPSNARMRRRETRMWLDAARLRLSCESTQAVHSGVQCTPVHNRHALCTPVCGTQPGTESPSHPLPPSSFLLRPSEFRQSAQRCSPSLETVQLYTLKSNARNHNFSTFCTRNAVSCL